MFVSQEEGATCCETKLFALEEVGLDELEGEGCRVVCSLSSSEDEDTDEVATNPYVKMC